MNAPWIWILFPGLVAVGLVFWPASTRAKARVGSGVALTLALLAWFLPVDRLITVVAGRVVVQIQPDWVVLGRALVLPDTLRPWVMGVYLALALWLWAAPWARMHPAFVSWAMVTTVFLVAALTVRPFLYAALLVEMAVLAAVPLLAPGDEPVGEGVVRYVAWTTLGMPFLLLAGSFLTGLETGSVESPQVIRAAALLAGGLLPWMGVVPFHSVAPLLTESTHPYRAAFTLTITTTIIGLFALGFWEQYTWLRDTPRTYQVLRLAGMVMFLLGSLWAPFQRHAGRALGYGWIAENGLGLLALGLGGREGVQAYAALMPARMVLMWALAVSLSILGHPEDAWHREALWGRAVRKPLASGLWVLGWAGLAAWPLTIGLWPRWHLARALTTFGPVWTGAFVAGLLALSATALRWLRVLLAPPASTENTGPLRAETSWDRIALVAGYALVVAGFVLPHVLNPWVLRAVEHFPHLLGK